MKKIILTGGIVFLIIVLDVINGSSFNFLQITAPVCLATQLFELLMIVLIISLFFKKELRKQVQKWSLAFLVPSVLAIAIEGPIEKYQYNKTRKSLAEICTALDNYKVENGKYPKTIEALQAKFLGGIPKAGFGLFNSTISYELLENGDTCLSYKVKFGFVCQAYNCGVGQSFSSWANCMN